MITQVDKRMLQGIDQTRKQRAGIHIPVTLIIPSLIFVTLFIVSGLVVLVSRSSRMHFNLFDTYANIMPRQSWQNIEAYEFECGRYNAGNRYIQACSLRPSTGVFSRITVERNGDTIDSIIFTVRENALTVGEVALELGVQSVGHRSRNSWTMGEIRAAVWTDLARFSNFQAVRAVYFYDRPQPDFVQE